MALPFFYSDTITPAAAQYVLNEETSKHVAQVLRMTIGEQLLLTDGKGHLFTAEITDDNRKKCVVKIVVVKAQAPKERKISIAISLVKNSNRLEWFLEKATEIGVSEIIPLLCQRTEKQHFRQDRMKAIVVSAMLQSQQSWLPVLQEPTKFSSLLQQTQSTQKFIAHCEEASKEQLADKLVDNVAESLILIGPEGDFSPDEIAAALQHGFLPVALGNTRLRTETAGVVAATLLCSR